MTRAAGRTGILGLDTVIGPDWHLLYVERASGTWGSPETIASLAGPAFSWASSQDGTRLHVAAAVPDGNPTGARTDLFGRSAAGWAEMHLAPTAGVPALGYGAGARLWLAGAGSLWEEP